jgi:hypothetical protein
MVKCPMSNIMRTPGKRVMLAKGYDHSDRAFRIAGTGTTVGALARTPKGKS